MDAVSLQGNLYWVGSHPIDLSGQNCIQLLSKKGHSTFISSSWLLATSPSLQSLLSSLCICQWNTNVVISLPSASDSSLKLLAQILCKGEADHTSGLQTTMDSLKEVQIVMDMLGINVKVVPRLKFFTQVKEVAATHSTLNH